MLITLVEKKDAILAILLSLMTGSFSCFLDRCMEKGMILRKYYSLICYYFWLPRKSKKHKSVMVKHQPRTITVGIPPAGMLGNEGLGFLNSISETTNTWVYIKPKFIKNKYQWLFKVLGGCVYCFGTWVAIVFYLGVLNDPSNLIATLIGLFLFIGMNYFWIEVILKIRK